MICTYCQNNNGNHQCDHHSHETFHRPIISLRLFVFLPSAAALSIRRLLVNIFATGNLLILFNVRRLLINAIFSFVTGNLPICIDITSPNCALDRSTILCLYVPGFQRQVFKHVKILSERLKRRTEQRERPCCGIRLQCTKCTVWPRNGCSS